MNKAQLVDGLNDKVDELLQWAENQEDDKFELSAREGKWTTGQHILHLIVSTKAVVLGMSFEKSMLKDRFGLNDREEKDYDGIYKMYLDLLANGPVVATAPYRPSFVKNEDKAAILAKFDEKRKDLIKALAPWSEEELSSYQLVHPLMGPMTIREMILFTIYHTEHHLKPLRTYH